jgi:hypothetical protein
LGQKVKRSTLTYDFFWQPVIPKALESRVSQFGIARPFGDGDFGDESRFHPMNSAVREAIGDPERGAWPLQFRKFLAQSPQRVAIESGSDRGNSPRAVPRNQSEFLAAPYSRRPRIPVAAPSRSGTLIVVSSNQHLASLRVMDDILPKEKLRIPHDDHSVTLR